MDNIILPAETEAGTSAQKTEFFIGTVVSWSTSAGAQIQLDGESAPLDKRFKVIRNGRPLVNNARYLIMKQSGTYVIIGEIGLPVNQ